jgi:hypothetical protein
MRERCITKLTIPHNAWIFIGESQKALFLRNAGNKYFLNYFRLRTRPANHEQGTDRRGCGFKRAMTKSQQNADNQLA